MRPKTVVPMTILAFFAFQSAYAQSIYHLPQVADGAGIRTTYIFFNNGTATASIEMTLHNDAGAVLPMPILGLGVAGVYRFTLDPGHTRFFRSRGEGPLLVGSGTVKSSVPIGVSAVFTLYQGTKILTETGIGASDPLTSFVIAADGSAVQNTGLAIQNLSPSSAATLTFELYYGNGALAGTQTRSLPALGHMAVYVKGPGGLFPAVSDIRGQLVVTSTTSVAAQTLRQGASGAPLTTLPVVPTSSAKTTFSLPQVADGVTPAIGVTTTFVMFNLGAKETNVSLDLTDSQGSPFPVTLTDEKSGSHFTASIPGHGALFLQTAGKGDLTAGAARVTSDAPIGVSGIFTLFDNQGVLTETGVGDSTPRKTFTLPADLTQGVNTGVAFFNHNAAKATVQISYADDAGVLGSVTSAPITLAGLGRQAVYITSLFSGLEGSQGQLIGISDLPLAAMALRQSAGGSPLTSLPVIGGGTVPAPALCSLGAGGSLDNRLQSCARLRDHIVWITGTGEMVKYPQWTTAQKNRLDRCYQGLLADQKDLGFTFPAPNEVLVDYGRRIYLTADEAFNLFAAHVAHVLYLETRNLVPWSILTYPDEELAELLSADRYVATIVPSSLTSYPADIQAGRDYQLPEQVAGLLGDPRAGRSFLLGTSPEHPNQTRNLVGPTEEETLTNMTAWLRDSAGHGPYFNALDYATACQRVLLKDRLKVYDSGEGWGSCVICYNGCHGAANLMRDLARSVNIPLLLAAAQDWPTQTEGRFGNRTHGALGWKWTRSDSRILWHTDELYAYSYREPCFPVTEGGARLNEAQANKQYFRTFWTTPQDWESWGFAINIHTVYPELGFGQTSAGQWEDYADYGTMLGYWRASNELNQDLAGGLFASQSQHIDDARSRWRYHTEYDLGSWGILENVCFGAVENDLAIHQEGTVPGITWPAVYTANQVMSRGTSVSSACGGCAAVRAAADAWEKAKFHLP